MQRIHSRMVCGIVVSALLSCVLVLGACGRSNARERRAVELLSAKYGEPFVVDENYGSSNVPGFDVFPFVIFEDYYTVAAHSLSHPDLVVEAHFDTKDDNFDDDYADLCVADNTRDYLATQYLQGLEGTYDLEVELKLPAVSDPAAATQLVLHEVEGGGFFTSAALYYAPAAGEVSSQEMYDLAYAMAAYLADNSSGSTVVTSVYLLDEAAGVGRVRDYVRGNRIGNYSTSDWQDAMGTAWGASVKFGADSDTGTSFESFTWNKLYPNQETPSIVIV